MVVPRKFSPYMTDPVFSQTAIDEQSGFFDTRFLS